MTYRLVRGSPHSHSRESDTHWGASTSQSKLVSFRLVHEGADQFDLGSVWDALPVTVRSGPSFNDDPNTNMEVLGFRLAWERS